MFPSMCASHTAVKTRPAPPHASLLPTAPFPSVYPYSSLLTRSKSHARCFPWRGGLPLAEQNKLLLLPKERRENQTWDERGFSQRAPRLTVTGSWKVSSSADAELAAGATFEHLSLNAAGPLVDVNGSVSFTLKKTKKKNKEKSTVGATGSEHKPRCCCC